ncbi:MAG TPA: tRNA lysidine(34) synthetase TilS, partial [Chloroflexia bacterium]|nr:tRNA lysidine(34) synthetase TilS [Chloroflexia bacterium]
DEDALVEGLLDARWSQVAGMDASGVRLDLTAFVALPAALQRRALRRAAQVMAGSLQGLASSHIEDARILLGPAGRTGGAVHWPHGLQVRRERDAAIVEACPPSTDPRWPSVTPGDLIELPSDGVCALGAGFVLQIRQERWTAALHMPADPGPWSAWFDADVLTAQAARPVVRTRRPGDRMRPLGAGGHTRKLQDVLVDGGVPRHLRDSLALLASHDGEVLWVPGPGGRRSVIAPVTPQTERVIIYSLVRTGEVAG